MSTKCLWPDGKRFAFTVFDDTDDATVANVGPVYAFLNDCGFRTTKSCWPVRGDPERGKHAGQTCEDPDYLQWIQELQAKGFEIGWHGATWHGSRREETLAALERFARLFRHSPWVATSHSDSEESPYWGADRLSAMRKLVYNILTRFRHSKRFRGHVEGDVHFWGDLCRQTIRYYRNFVFQDINTLKCCPWMPYHDPQRPYVNYWFASSNGSNVESFNRCLSEGRQDRLEEEGGVCIVYAHFASGFVNGNRVHARFEALLRRLAAKDGWFVPVGTLLDHLLEVQGHHELSHAERRRLERKWLLEKVFVGSN